MCGELHVASRLQASCITAWKQQPSKHVECLARGRMLSECCNTRSTSVLLLTLLWFAAYAVLLCILLLECCASDALCYASICSHFDCALQVILMDHVDWLDEAAASQLASRLADQVHFCLNSGCLPAVLLLEFWSVLRTKQWQKWAAVFASCRCSLLFGEFVLGCYLWDNSYHAGAVDVLLQPISSKLLLHQIR